MSEKRFWPMLNIILLLLLGLVVLVAIQWPDKNLHLVFCDVGQGDAVLVSYQNQQLLVDGGPDNSVLSCLGKNMPFWDRKIELVVLTHGDSDHVTGLIGVLRRYQVNQVVNNGLTKQAPEFMEFERAVKQAGLEIKAVNQGDKIKLGEVRIKVIWPAEQVAGAESTNEHSVVMLGQFGEFNRADEFDFLLSGDIEAREEEVLRLTAQLKDIEILKVGHHGSKTSSTEQFLQAVKPELAVISVGENWFGHPAVTVLQRLGVVGAKILRTDEQGMVEVISDGKGWWTK